MRRWISSLRKSFARRADLRRDSERARWGADAGDAARVVFDWNTAVRSYQSYLRMRPNDLGVSLRLAKTLESAGRVEESQALLVELVKRRPDSEAAGRHLAALTDEAGRETGFRMDHVEKRYQAFRETFVVPEAPEGADGPVHVLVDARQTPPALVRATLMGLQAQTFADWTATILVTPDLLSHPLASMALVDQRLRFTSVPDAAPTSGEERVLFLQAGAVLEPRALVWLVHVAILTGASLVYADHDRSADHWLWGRFWFDPALFPEPHAEDFATSQRPPVAILALARIVECTAFTLFAVGDPTGRSRLLRTLCGTAPMAHVPLLLSTLLEAVVIDEVFEAPAAPGGDTMPESPVRADDLPSEEAQNDRILVIIPTRDEAASLKTMVDSLRARAERPSRVDIVVIDNGSRNDDTLSLLAGWRNEGSAEVITADEPFNWSRLNNLAAAHRSHEIFLFANNDMEMLTAGWDMRLAVCLRRPGVGASGARLLYPGGQIQHAGMALGALLDGPLHEGLGEGSDEDGPLGRWTRNRPAAAVTGAFLAVRRDVFEAVGGFNAFGLAIACNDIDFCLRVRERGLTVMFQADIELTHHESRTRGHADTGSKKAWAAAEMATVHRTWGEDFIRDPSRSPAWRGRDVQVFHEVTGLDREAVLARVSEPSPWSARRP